MYRFILVITAILFMSSSCGPNLPQIEVDFHNNVVVYTAEKKGDQYKPIEHIYPKELQVIVEDYRHIQGVNYKNAFTVFLYTRFLSERGGWQNALDDPYPYHGYIFAHSGSSMNNIGIYLYDKLYLKGHLTFSGELPITFSEMNTLFSQPDDSTSGSLDYQLMVLFSCYLGDTSNSMLGPTGHRYFLAKFIQPGGIIIAPEKQTWWTAAWEGRTEYIYAKKLIEIINSDQYESTTLRSLTERINRETVYHREPHFRVYKRVEGQNVVAICNYSKISDYYHKIGD